MKVLYRLLYGEPNREARTDRGSSYLLLLLASLSVWSAMDAPGETARFLLLLLSALAALLMAAALHPQVSGDKVRPTLRVAAVVFASLYVILRVWFVI